MSLGLFKRGAMVLGGMARGAMAPLASLYFLGWRLWLFLYESRILPTKRVDSFVVSIGNLTVGGTGKTSLTLFLAQRYQEKGERVGIVSRGYKGRYTGPMALVSDGRTLFESVETVGDEPYLLAKRLDGVPIVVARDRAVGAKWLIDHFHVTVILLDDGFQHLRLQRDLNLLLLDCTETQTDLLPLGRMREPFSSARRADMIILTRQEEMEPPRGPGPDRFDFAGPILKTACFPAALIHLKTGATRSPSDLQKQSVFAFCGIGKPQAFFQMLIRLGAILCDTRIFPDHVRYRLADLHAMAQEGRRCGAQWILTTEKDSVKLERFSEMLGDIWVLRLETAFLDASREWERYFFCKTR